MVAHGTGRLERAIDAVMKYRARREPEPREAFLAANGDLRDLLEPLLDDDDSIPAAGVQQRLGEFTLLREIGRGGMGVVFEALQPSVDRRVALKVLVPHLTQSPAAVARFKREATLVARLQHPGIVDLYAVGSQGETHYFAMQLVEGVALQRVLARLRAAGPPPESAARLRDVIEQRVNEQFGTALPRNGAGAAHWHARTYVEAIVRIVADVADALQHAHEAQVVHRDIKPANILVQRDGRALVTDFGIARDEQSPQLTATGEFPGTPWYAAPEQLARRQEADQRSDVFSLGATLYEALTLRRPFDGETAVQVAESVLHREPTSPRQFAPNVSTDLAAVVLKALEKDPRRRYQTAGAFAADLRACLDGRPVSAHAVGNLQRAWRWARRNKALAALAVALLATLTVTATWIVAQNIELSDALLDTRRLADLYRVEDFRRQHNHLPAAHPDDAGKLEAWLRDAKPLVDNIKLHQRRLQELRTRALPYTDADREGDTANHPRRKALQSLQDRVDEMERKAAQLDSDGSDPEELAHMRAWLATAHGKVAELRTATRERLTWRLPDVAEQREHDQLTDLLRRCAEFVHPEQGTWSRVRAWLDHMRTVRARSLEGEAAGAWRDVIDAIADPARSPQYTGLRLRPQLGLVPLGKDPASGLFEFAHLQTGRVPTRDPQGRLQFDGESGLVFVLLPGGTFRMGSSPFDSEEPQVCNRDRDSRPDETEHSITLAPFFLSKFEMTQGQWFRFLGQRPSRFTEHNYVMFAEPTWLHPVETVSWVSCDEVMRATRLALPTEAQWEYAARAGSATAFAYGDEPISLVGAINALDRRAVRRYTMDGDSNWGPDFDDGCAMVSPVGRYRPNRFGLHDMLGNVDEWCADSYTTYDRPVQPGDGLRIAVVGHGRVVRGGNYLARSVELRVARRVALEEWTAASEIGLRPARALDP